MNYEMGLHVILGNKFHNREVFRLTNKRKIVFTFNLLWPIRATLANQSKPVDFQPIRSKRKKQNPRFPALRTGCLCQTLIGCLVYGSRNRTVLLEPVSFLICAFYLRG